MKKIFLSLAALIVLAVSASAFGLREHSAIAVIAEKYLTPKAQAAVSDILDGNGLVIISSYPDQYRKEWIIDGKKIPHMFPVNDDVNGDWSMKGDATSNAALALDRSLAVLKQYKKADKKDVAQALAIVTHLTGDIHCPSHLKESKESSHARPYYYRYEKKKLKFHSAWDSGIASLIYSGGPLDIAYIADIATPEQRAEIQKGDPESWASESARICYPYTHDIPMPEGGYSKEEGEEVTKPYLVEHAVLVKDQVMRAGYRLAQLLNTVFK